VQTNASSREPAGTDTIQKTMQTANTCAKSRQAQEAPTKGGVKGANVGFIMVVAEPCQADSRANKWEQGSLQGGARKKRDGRSSNCTEEEEEAQESNPAEIGQEEH
jgi:hypothetical protein